MEVNGVIVFIFCGQPSDHQVLPEPDSTTSKGLHVQAAHQVFEQLQLHRDDRFESVLHLTWQQVNGRLSLEDLQVLFPELPEFTKT